MKFLKSVVLLPLAFFFLSTCGKTIGTEQSIANASPIAGSWITDCLDMGAGAVSRVYTEINSNNEASQAHLQYTGLGCTGTYVLRDSAGNLIDVPTRDFNYSVEEVSDRPSNIFVIRTTSVGLGNSEYSIVYLSGSKFYELSAFANAHPTWAEWLAEPDVAGFVANPETFVPTTTALLRFNSGPLPQQ